MNIRLHPSKIFFFFIILTVIILLPPDVSSLKNKSISVIKEGEIYYPHMLNITEEDKIWVEQKIAEMTLEEKCAQLIMPAIYRSYLYEESTGFTRIIELAEKYKTGGFIFFDGDIESHTRMIDTLSKVSGLPLLIASDFERGPGMRVDEGTLYPYNMGISASGELMMTYYMAKSIAAESKLLGYNFNLAPVADINNNADNPVINIRSFSEDKNIVAAFVTNFVRGSVEGKMLCAVKHFPGHGNTTIDSHTELPIIPGSEKEIFENELFPFIEAISAGVPAVMTGHLNVPAFDSVPGVPASLSERIVTGLLKHQLNYDGLIITDALNMQAVTKYFSDEDAAVLAVRAGNDILLMPPDPVTAINAIKDAVQNKSLSLRRIEESVRKILSAKKWIQNNNELLVKTEVPESVERMTFEDLAHQMYQKSITLVKNSDALLPVSPALYKKPACITITNGIITIRESEFSSEILLSLPGTGTKNIDKFSKTPDYLEALAISEESDLIIIAAFINFRQNDQMVSVPEDQKKLIEDIINLHKPVVFISFGNPYLLSLFPSVDVYICTYGGAEYIQKIVPDYLTGRKNFEGRLPVSIPGTEFIRGHGLTLGDK
ncbi:MAG: hypothetical protein Kow0098_19810 [Ignavibacteriaceae bacterium]